MEWRGGRREREGEGREREGGKKRGERKERGRKAREGEKKERNKSWKFLGHSHVAGTTMSSKSLHQNSQVRGQQAAHDSDRHGVQSRRASTCCTMCESSVALSGERVHVPEPPGWEDSHSQHTGVNKLAQSLGTNPAHNRHTSLQEGEMRDVSPFT